MGIAPTANEQTQIKFTIKRFDLTTRYLLAGGIFLVGILIVALTQLPWFGGVIIALGHIPLWTKTQRIAPGGATPTSEINWAPVETGWLHRVRQFEARSEKWDITPWDISNQLGCLTFGIAVGLALLIPVALAMLFDLFLAGSIMFRGWLIAIPLFVPIWFNGMRSIWHPSELRLKGEALAIALNSAEPARLDNYEVVPMLGLRRNRRGQYPADARVMLRPKQETPPSFIGVQIQVSLNNVQGKDYPYLYCVVLGKPGYKLPAPEESSLVLEPGASEGADYLVVRQYADNSGGWHTKPAHIGMIVKEALDLAEQSRRMNA